MCGIVGYYNYGRPREIVPELFDCVAQFDALVTDVVKCQMVSDVALGVFLSSGTDSFAVTRAMQKVETNPGLAFSIGFENKPYDELPTTEQAAHAPNVRLVSGHLVPIQALEGKTVADVGVVNGRFTKILSQNEIESLFRTVGISDIQMYHRQGYRWTVKAQKL